MGRYQDLFVYQKALQLTLLIYEESKTFPREDIMGITSQIRRSSAAVCAILAESYGRRRQEKYYLYKLHEIAGENAETQVWLDLAWKLNRMTDITYHALSDANQEIGRLIRHMINHPEQFS
jgi:four helix bundle protein